MGLKIGTVTITRQESQPGKLVFTISTDTRPNSATAILSRNLSTSYSSLDIVESTAYSPASHAATFTESLLTDLPDLFFLLDTGTSANHNLSNIVRVFFGAPEIAAYKVTASNELCLYPDRSKRDTLLASHMVWALEAESIHAPLPDWSARLELYGLQDSPSLQADLGFFHYDENASAEVFGLTKTFSFLIAPPPISRVVYNAGTLTADTAADAPTQVQATLTVNGETWDTALLTKTASNTYVWNALTGLDPSLFYDVSFQGKNTLGLSKPTPRFPLLTAAPSVASCEFTQNGTTISMDLSAVYSVKINDTTTTVVGSEITVSSQPESVEIRFHRGKSFGPILTYRPRNPAYYACVTNDETFYHYCERPSVLGALEIGVPGVTISHTGTYFSVSGETLTVTAAAFTDDMDTVHADYAQLLSLCAAADGTQARVLEAAVQQSLPMRPGEMLFYRCRFHPEQGYVDLIPGMALQVEYANYQYIPDAYRTPGVNAGLNGYTGSGAVVYPVIIRGGLVSFEPFLRSMIDAGGVTVPPPPPIEDDNALLGGAGALDLLFEGLNAPFVRLVYPVETTARGSSGSMNYYQNACLLTASDLDLLDNAVAVMHEMSVPFSTVRSAMDGVAYTDFRGRAALTPLLRVTVNGSPVWLPVGTTLDDVAWEYGSRRLTLYRQSVSGLCPVIGAPGDLPLLPGDGVRIV